MEYQIIHLTAELLPWIARGEDGLIDKDIIAELQPLREELSFFQPCIVMGNCECVFVLDLDCIKGILNMKVDINIQKTGQSNNSSNIDYLASQFEGRVKDLCFVINLAHPGAIHIIHYKIYKDGIEVISDGSFPTDLWELARGIIEKEIQWPNIDELPVQQCWNWIKGKTNFLSDFSETNIDRALNALSYTCVSNTSEASSIFYILLGIEAIYNEGRNREDSIMEQLLRKTRALLGDYPIQKEKIIQKQVKEMYRMRSLFSHGVTNFPKCWDVYVTDDDKLEEYYLKTLNPMHLATAILISTIQAFIKSNANILTETTQVILS